jgi:hypothetical protein
VHELGHLIFGLPDLYDTDGSSSGIGAFCVMSGGSWGKAIADTYYGQRPVLPSAWVRYNRRWATGAAVSTTTTTRKTITAVGAATATSANTVFRRPTSIANQYFLVENRQPQGYDRGLELVLGSGFGGIAIWHIDDSRSGLDDPNANDVRRWVDLEEADATQMGTSRGENTDLWYVGNKTVFSNSSVPNSKLYGGTSSGAVITTKTVPGTTMKVQFSQ